MSRPKKVISLESKNEVVTEVFPKVMFNNKEFEIHPLSDHKEDLAYEDSTKFLILAIPVGSKVFNELLKINNENPAAINRIAKGASGDDDGMTQMAIDLMDIISSSNVENLLEDLSDALPKLATIACHYTDPSVTESDIKRWSKSPLNINLWKAVIEQFKADNVIGQIAALRGIVGEFGAAA